MFSNRGIPEDELRQLAVEIESVGIVFEGSGSAYNVLLDAQFMQGNAKKGFTTKDVREVLLENTDISVGIACSKTNFNYFYYDMNRFENIQKLFEEVERRDPKEF